jgi:signal transduction histidine kinase
MKYLRNSILLLILVSVTPALRGQTVMNLDSLLKMLPEAMEDSAAVQLYINIGQQYENSDLAMAKSYYNMAGKLSERLDYHPGIIGYINNYTYVLNLEGKFDSSLVLLLRAVEIARSTNDSINLAKALLNTGSVYRITGDYEKAITYYSEGHKRTEKLGNLRLSAQINDLLQVLYSDLRQYDKAIEYGKKAVEYFRNSGDLNLLGVSLNNLAVCYSHSGNHEEALVLFKEILGLGRKLNDRNMEGTALLNIGDYYLKQAKYNEMEPYYRKALDLFSDMETPEGTIIALRGLSLYNSSRGNFQLALDYARKSTDLAAKNKLPEQRRKSLAATGHVYYALHDVKNAEKYLGLSTELGDSLINAEVHKQVLEVESKYRNERQADQIRQLESEKEISEYKMREKVLIIQTLIGISLTLLIVGFLLYRNYRHKQALQQQKIKELETEKQLRVTEAVLKGEQQERSRLAKDLHDGLGGLLSGIKYSFLNIKENLILTPENASTFERNLDMLDTSIQEMRRVAHNLMPESLFKFGLDATLREYCTGISNSGVITIRYQSFGMDTENPDQSVSVSIYRIIQELINNIIKHSGAAFAMVQLSKSGDLMLIDVEDDGKGFDADLINQAKGMGWSNIRKRLEYLKGDLSIQSEPGKGTSIHIEIRLA